MIKISCRFHPSGDEHGANFISKHLGTIMPNLVFFRLILDEEKTNRILYDALKNRNAIIKVEFEDFTMEIT